MEKKKQILPKEITVKEKWHKKAVNFLFKNLFSICALIISFLAYNLNDNSSLRQEKLYTQQEKEWNAINMARIAIVDAHFFTFRTVNREEMIRDTLYGVQSASEKENSPNTFMIKYLLNGFDTVNNKNIMSSSVSMKDFIKEMNDKKIDSRNKIFVKLFSPVITIKNVGQTTCTIDSIVIHDLIVHQGTIVSQANINNEPSHKLGQHNFTLEPSQEFINTSFKINAALGTENPVMNFHYDIFYKNFIGDTLSLKVLVNTQDGGFWLEDIYSSSTMKFLNYEIRNSDTD